MPGRPADSRHLSPAAAAGPPLSMPEFATEDGFWSMTHGQPRRVA
ncbi:hypothetical protein [Caenispirillum salinarum]